MRVQTGADSSVADRTQVRDRMRMAAIPRMIMGNRAPMTTTTRARNMALRRQIRLMIHGRRAVCARRHDVGQTRDLEIRRMMAGRGGHPPTLHAAAAAMRVAIVDVAATDQMARCHLRAPRQISTRISMRNQAAHDVGHPPPQIIAMDARQSHAASHRPMMIGTAARAMMTGMVMTIAGSNLRRARAMTVACHRTSQHGINR